MKPDDRFLLCSDGLHGVLGEHDIAWHLSRDGDRAKALVRAVLRKRLLRQDNVTVVFVRVVSG